MPLWKMKYFERSEVGSQGFTMLELLVVVFILAILANTAISATIATLKSIDKNTARVQIVQDIRRAQATAVTEGCRGIFAITIGGSSYTYGCDYLPYDTNPIPAADTVIFTSDLPGNITVAASGLIIFNSRGQVVDADYSLVTRTVTLTSHAGGTNDFATGTLRATGFFSYD